MKDIKTNSLKAWFLAARPKTLSAASRTGTDRLGTGIQ